LWRGCAAALSSPGCCDGAANEADECACTCPCPQAPALDLVTAVKPDLPSFRFQEAAFSMPPSLYGNLPQPVPIG
jgi:hypothetical protein